MSLKAGNFSFQARTAQNRLRMGKYSTYLEFCRSREALALAIGSGSENLTRTRPAQNPEEIKWEETLNGVQMLHLPLQLPHSALLYLDFHTSFCRCFSFSLAWHHLNFRTAIVRGADIKWALHHCPNAIFRCPIFPSEFLLNLNAATETTKF